MHASILKSKMCLAAKSYEMTLAPPVYCWVGGWVIRFQQNCKENKSGTKQTLANEQAHYLSAAKYVNTEAD